MMYFVPYKSFGDNEMTATPQDTKECIACADDINARAEICPKCGVRQPAFKFCGACGAQLDARAEICPKCGVRQVILPQSGATATTSVGEKSRVVAAVLAILLGGLGVHKFYLGNTGLGILYLVFCWTFIPAILGIVEGIMYLTMTDAAFAAKYSGPTPPAF